VLKHPALYIFNTRSVQSASFPMSVTLFGDGPHLFVVMHFPWILQLILGWSRVGWMITVEHVHWEYGVMLLNAN
jgi:hypothetical protein